MYNYMISKIATTVKIENNLYDNFKILGVRHKLTLQGLVERSVFRYVNDEKFREGINNFIFPVVSDGIALSTTSSII